MCKAANAGEAAQASDEKDSVAGRRRPAGITPPMDMPGGFDDLFAERKIGVFVKGHRGKTSMPFVIWESVDKCDTTRCPVATGCEYIGFCQDGKCAVQAKYLSSVINTVFSAINGKADELALMEVGMLLIPLFNQLVKLKIQEVGLQGQIVEMTKKGPMINPILKEIRACIMTIKATMQDLIHRKDIKGPLVGDFGGNPTCKGNDQEGTPDYYASLRTKSKKPHESVPGIMLTANHDDVVFTPSPRSERTVPKEYRKLHADHARQKAATLEEQAMMDQEASQEN